MTKKTRYKLTALGLELRAARRLSGLWMDAEEFVRYLLEHCQDQVVHLKGIVLFTNEDWLAVHQGDRTRDTAMRAFERWKAKFAEEHLFIDESSLDIKSRSAVEHARDRLPRDRFFYYSMHYRDISERTTEALARVEALEQKLVKASGKRTTYKRDATTREAASALGVSYSTLMGWLGVLKAPATRVPIGGSKYRYMLSVEEMEEWIRKKEEAGMIPSPDRVPIGAFLAVARKLQKRNFSYAKIGEAVGMSGGSIRHFFRPKGGPDTVPAFAYQKALEVLNSGRSYASLRGSFGSKITKEQLQDAVDANGGSLFKASRALGLKHPGAAYETAKRYGIKWNKATEVVTSWATREDVIEVCTRASSIQEASRLLGTSRPDAVLTAARAFGIEDEAVKLLGIGTCELKIARRCKNPDGARSIKVRCGRCDRRVCYGCRRQATSFGSRWLCRPCYASAEEGK